MRGRFLIARLEATFVKSKLYLFKIPSLHPRRSPPNTHGVLRIKTKRNAINSASRRPRKQRIRVLAYFIHSPIWPGLMHAAAARSHLYGGPRVELNWRVMWSITIRLCLESPPPPTPRGPAPTTVSGPDGNLIYILLSLKIPSLPAGCVGNIQIHVKTKMKTKTKTTDPLMLNILSTKRTLKSHKRVLEEERPQWSMMSPLAPFHVHAVLI